MKTVKLTYRDKQWELPAGMTVRDAILKCGLNPEQVLAVRAGKLINDSVLLKDGDEVKLVAVISGGASSHSSFSSLEFPEFRN